jgi:hypothetical protein
VPSPRKAGGGIRTRGTDVSDGWLVTACLALIHAAAEEVRTGELDSKAAFDALSVTVTDLFAGRR